MTVSFCPVSCSGDCRRVHIRTSGPPNRHFRRIRKASRMQRDPGENRRTGRCGARGMGFHLHRKWRWPACSGPS